MNKALISLMIVSSVFVLVSCSETKENTSVEQADNNVVAIADALPQCSVSVDELSGWFASGSVTNGGMVNPAVSTAFPPLQNTKCDFYKWAAQMFLWLTSPSGSSYVFDGDTFYDVVPQGSEFVFVSNADNDQNRFAVRSAKPIDIGSTAQAGGSGVLLTQDGSLTYYGIHTNDVYAYYLTGQKAGDFAGTSIATAFPTTEDDLILVEKSAGKTFPDASALTLELKTSWVPVSAVPNADRYITITAMVPSYDRSDAKSWTLNADMVEAELALVGMHVVGSVNGHPELVWASFESFRNAPFAAYSYEMSDGAVQNVPYDSSGTWLFMEENGAEITHISELAHVDSSGNIVATTDADIAPNNVVLLNPWGNLPGSSGDMGNSGELIQLAQSLNSQLSSVQDPRANYFQLGGIWSQKGQIPTSGTDDFLRGSLYLANATMETFHQYPDENSGFVSNNCFTCHSTSSGESINVSHIFGSLQPLK